MQKFIVIASSIVLFGLVQGGNGSNYVRVARDGETNIVEKIGEAMVRLRHAQSRLKTFTDEIEAGLNTGVVQTTLGDTEDKFEKGQVDFFKLVKAFREHSSNSFPDLIKRVADDTHILMDQLYGRLDKLGSLSEGVQHDAADTSAEEHHKKA